MDKTEAYKLHSSWIAACQESDRLSEWEADFIESVKTFLESRGSLSPKQVEILERIYAAKTD